MVDVTHVMVLLLLFILLLAVGLLLLSGILPGFREAFGNASCTLGVC